MVIISLTTDLVSYWKFDGNATDSVGSNDLTVDGATNSSSYGKINQGYLFDGTNDRLYNYNVASDVSSSSTGSFGGWFYIDDYTSQRILMHFGDQDARAQLTIQVETSGLLTAVCRTSSGNQWAVDTDSTITTDTWLHIMLVQDGTEPVIYINGAKPAQTFFVTTDKTSWWDSIPGLDTFNIGAREYNSGGVSTFYKGYIDEPAIWTRALSAVEVGQLYNFGDGLQYPFTTPTGWTGKIRGQTNPSKIRGIAVANISKVKGVE